MSLLDRWRRRRNDVPEEVRSALVLDRGDPVLAAASLDDGSTAAATRSRLVVGDTRGRRLDVPWHEVDSAVWDPDQRLVEARLVSGTRVRLGVRGDERTMLPEVIRERVQSSVVLARKVDVQGRRGVRVVVRRTPQGLATQTLADRGIDLTDPVVSREVERVRLDLERAAGMEGPR